MYEEVPKDDVVVGREREGKRGRERGTTLLLASAEWK